MWSQDGNTRSTDETESTIYLSSIQRTRYGIIITYCNTEHVFFFFLSEAANSTNKHNFISGFLSGLKWKNQMFPYWTKVVKSICDLYFYNKSWLK